MLLFLSQKEATHQPKNNNSLTMKLTEASRLAQKLFYEHGIEDWRFKYSRSVRRFGVCVPRIKLIAISKPLVELNEEARVKNTLLHEIAHALTPGHGHDRVWRSMAIAMGCDGRRCYDHTAVIRPEAPFIGTCGCPKPIKRHRRNNIMCMVCKQPFKFTRNKKAPR